MTSGLWRAPMFVLALLLLTSPAHAQHSAMPPGMTHEQHMAQMKKEAEMKARGKQAMGFDQDTTTHHFATAPDGGSIAVDVNSPDDRAGRDQIRAHLKEIAAAFRQGDFAKPFMTHSEQPPGVPDLQRLKSEITYIYTETPRGGIVRIITGHPEALAAVHAFLTYQIAEHGTAGPAAAAAAPEAIDQAAHQGAGTVTSAAPDHLKHQFDNPSEWAKSFDDPARDDWQMPARVIDALQLTPGMKVADVGAGTGYFTMRLAKAPAAPTVYAVDIEKGMVEHIQQRAMHDGLTNIVGVLAGADRSNLPEPVDLVLMVDTYHHIPNRVAYFNALKSHMKPGARLAIIDFRKGAPAGPPEEFRFTAEQISAELAQAGFALQTSHDFLPRQLFLVYSRVRADRRSMSHLSKPFRPSVRRVLDGGHHAQVAHEAGDSRLRTSVDYDASYLHEIVEASPRAAWMFSRAAAIGKYRKDVPVAAWTAAAIAAVRHEDCGPCTQLGVSMAERAGVDAKVLRAVLTEDPARCRTRWRWPGGSLAPRSITIRQRIGIVRRSSGDGGRRP
jgi:ubiquinone/menaquinone biosynthesis C-methylase UbiE